MTLIGARLTLIVLICVVLSFAQNLTICDGPSISIRTNADVSRISSCATYNGNVIITSDATGTIDLHGIQQISGDLVCKNAAGLNGIVSDTLETIGGTFGLESLTTLNNLTFPALDRVANVSWSGLRALSEIHFDYGIGDCSEIHISDTILQQLEDFEMSQTGVLDITNNTWLDHIIFSSLEKVSKSATFAFNGENLKIEMPCLATTGDLTFQNAWMVQVPLLSHVFGTLAFYAGSSQNISVPNLTAIENSFVLSDYKLVDSVSLPSLANIGGSLSIVNNSALGAIDGIGQLQSVAGNMTLIGTFDRLECPSLRDVRGGATVMTSSQNKTLCNVVQSLKEQVVRQNVSCAVSMATLQTNGTTAPTPPTPSPTNLIMPWNGLSADARVAIVLAAVVVGLSASVTVAWFLCIRPRLLHKRRIAEFGKNKNLDADSVIPGKAELRATPSPLPVSHKEKQLKPLPVINTTILRSTPILRQQPTVRAATNEDRNIISPLAPQDVRGTRGIESPVISPEHANPWDKYFTSFETSNTYELCVNSRKTSPQPKKQVTEDSYSEQSPESIRLPKPLSPSPPRVRSTIFFRPDTLFSTTKNGKSTGSI